MSICRIRLVYWLVLTGITVIGGIATDLTLQTNSLPVWLHMVGLAGMVLAHFPLKRTGKLLGRLTNPEEWGCTNQLVTSDIYRCIRHPHHFFIGVFMTSLGLLIGHTWSVILISVPQWIWILGFLFLVEEKELLGKFDQEYKRYRQKVPMLIGNPKCIFEVLTHPLEGT
jgi:protein-S-isoprenylcysteine O-methyltransferase Ste14